MNLKSLIGSRWGEFMRYFAICYALFGGLSLLLYFLLPWMVL